VTDGQRPSAAKVMAVEVMLLPVESSDAGVVLQLSSLLDEVEQSRLRALRQQDDRIRFVAARLLARFCLSRRHPAAPGDWGFSQTPAGKPFVREPVSARHLEFNLSHTQGLVGCATADVAVGFDIERLDPKVDLYAEARHGLADAEIVALSATSTEQRTRRFLSFWTAKEAVAKAVGTGMATPFASLAFTVGRHGEAVPANFPPEFGVAASWTVRALDHDGTHVGAVAVGPVPHAVGFHVERLGVGDLRAWAENSRQPARRRSPSTK
jgi:4'-phosphopantetheinyl transferase